MGFGDESAQKRSSSIFSQPQSTDPFSHGPIFLCPSRLGLLKHKNRVSPSFMSFAEPPFLAETIDLALEEDIEAGGIPPKCSSSRWMLWQRKIALFDQTTVLRGCEKIEDQIDFEVILVSKSIVSKLAYSIE
ncbi:MAG: hypothetical protein K1000chlam3_01442 [Chlamydiae bacterium]|nr:hypothetical protein [Chlamydiota bacterium]